MKTLIFSLLLTLFAATPAFAHHYDARHAHVNTPHLDRHQFPHNYYTDRDPHTNRPRARRFPDYFRPHLQEWSHGRWFHGNNAGRFGWFWIVGGVYFFYALPQYPFPNPTVPPGYYDEHYYYFCADYNQYYPYIAICPQGWTMVPVNP